MVQVHFSDVYYQLDSKNKARYHEKIAMTRNEDPYALKKTDFSKDVSLLPSLKSVLRFLTLRIPSLDIKRFWERAMTTYSVSIYKYTE